MIPDVSQTKLLQAIEEYDAALRGAPEWKNWESKDTYKYAIVHEDKRYPVKQIIRMATGATDFSGGEQANNYVTQRGLVVVPLENASADKDSVGLRDRLEEILAEYASARANEPLGGHELRRTFKGVSDAITTTRAVRERPSLKPTWSIGQGNWVTIPWIALLDARETDTTQRGAYGVYLFREDMSGVYFAFAQGVTEPRDWYHSTVRAREHLRAQAKDIRRYCEDLAQQGFALDNNIDLHTDAVLGIDYEASTVAHKFYAAGSVPDDQMLISDLEAVLSAYDRYLEDPKSRRWCIYAGRSAATNFDLAREKAVWGADNGTKFEGIERGDLVWFVHDLVSDESPPPSGFPRVKLREFRGIAKLAVLGRVTSDVFKDSSSVWPDGTYPYRFDFEEVHEAHEVMLNKETFSPSVGNAVRRSAIAQGRPVLAREWGPSVLNGGNPASEDTESLFSVETFELLVGLHDDPTKAYYQEHRESIRDHVEEPFRWLVRQVVDRLPAPITGLMETEKGVLAKILMNDYGRGGAWPFYWGAFYPKGGKRIKDAQLSTVINKDQLGFGFYIGHYGSDQRE